MRALIRGLIDTITLTPVDGRQEVAIRGELATILQLAVGARNAQSRPGEGAALCEQIKMVAGTGYLLDLLLAG